MPLGRVPDDDSPARVPDPGVHVKGEGFRGAIDLHIRRQGASGPLAAHFQAGMGLLPGGAGAVEDQSRQVPFRQANRKGIHAFRPTPGQRKFHVGQVEGRQFERGCLVFAIRLEVVHPFEGGGFNAHTLDIDQRPPPGLETRRLQGQGLDLGQRLTPFGQAPFEAMEGDAKGGVVETDGPDADPGCGCLLRQHPIQLVDGQSHGLSLTSGRGEDEERQENRQTPQSPPPAAAANRASIWGLSEGRSVLVHRLPANFATEMMPHRHGMMGNREFMDEEGDKVPQRIMLGIESSCDDTSIAVLRGSQFVAQFTAAQHIHAKYGGVVPEFASRAHQRHILPVLHGVLEQAGLTLDDLDGVAYTRGPGLHGSLLVGSAFARSLAWSRSLPLWPVHHMRAHVLAHWISDANPPSGPMMALTVSGGHTQLVDVRSPWDLVVVGTTLDDAAGEAFDKVAKMIGLPYPGGPHVDRLAKEGNPEAFAFAAPRMDGLDFSFSGLKTSVLRTLERDGREAMEREGWQADVCASLQQTIVEMLVSRLEQAADQYGRTAIAIQGGVSANSGLRNAVQELGERRGWSVHIPPFKYCTDNGAMIAMAGQFAAMKGAEGALSDGPRPRWPMVSDQT